MNATRTGEEGTGAWPAGWVIRPPAGGEPGEVEIADVVGGRSARCEAGALCAGLLAADGPRPGGPLADLLPVPAPDGAERRQSLEDGWHDWERRGWQPSHQYYVASRPWEPGDGDGAAGAREDTRGQPPEPRRHGRPAPLGAPLEPGTRAVGRLLAERRSQRSFADRPVPRAALSGVLAYGLAGVRDGLDRSARAQPPAPGGDGAGSAWDVYVCVLDVDGLEAGAYRYDLEDHALAMVRPGDHRAELVSILQGMNAPSTAAWMIVLVADFPRSQWLHPHEDGLRRLYVESGLLAQELIILGSSYGLGTLVTPAQKDSPMLALLELPADRYAPVYTLTMGPLSPAGAGADPEQRATRG